MKDFKTIVTQWDKTIMDMNSNTKDSITLEQMEKVVTISLIRSIIWEKSEGTKITETITDNMKQVSVNLDNPVTTVLFAMSNQMLEENNMKVIVTELK